MGSLTMRLNLLVVSFGLMHVQTFGSHQVVDKRAVFDLIPSKGERNRVPVLWEEVEKRKARELRREEMRRRREKLRFLFKHAMKRRSSNLQILPVYFMG